MNNESTTNEPGADEDMPKASGNDAGEAWEINDSAKARREQKTPDDSADNPDKGGSWEINENTAGD